MDARTTIIRPVVSEKSYALIGEGKYTFRVDDRANKTQHRSQQSTPNLEKTTAPMTTPMAQVPWPLSKTKFAHDE